MKRKNVLPHAGGGGSFLNRLSTAFTMAEILLSLTIIGVVAAITLPSLTGNINERTWNTQRKAIYARFSQAILLMPAINGYGTLAEGVDESGSNVVTEDTGAETFITDGLAKVMKINNICDNEHLYDCGFSSKITTRRGNIIDLPKNLEELNGGLVSGTSAFSYSMINTKAAAFETANGESVLTFYNPRCVPDSGDLSSSSNYHIQPYFCANFIYDLNGNKGPNTVGKDIGIITALYPSDTVVVSPYPHLQFAGNNVTQYDASKTCTAQDPEYRIPNIEELIAIYVNGNLFETILDGAFWSSTLYDSSYGLAMSGMAGRKIKYLRSENRGLVIQCVKR